MNTYYPGSKSNTHIVDDVIFSAKYDPGLENYSVERGTTTHPHLKGSNIYFKNGTGIAQ